MKKLKGFTLAEILITLSIIGIVAAISIPSLLVNINDKTYAAQRSALLARMSQAIGQMDDVSAYKSGGTSDNSSAVKFISQGLSKVYKISSVCGKGHFDSCDIAEEIKVPSGTDFTVADHGTFKSFNSIMGNANVMGSFDTDSAAFLTTNGESILVYYNPKCKDMHESSTDDVFSEVCVNMIYDLNGGSKAPNQYGKDIGFMTILYPSTPTVVSPVPYSVNATEAPSFGAENTDAASTCSNLSANLILPDRDSLVAMALNKSLIGNLEGEGASTVKTFWSATVKSATASGEAWAISTDGKAQLAQRDGSKSIRCIKKD